MSDIQWMKEYNKMRTQLAQVSSTTLLPSKSKHLQEARQSFLALSDQLKSIEKNPAEYGLSKAKVVRRRSLLENVERQMNAIAKNEGIEPSAIVENSSSTRIAAQKSVMQEHDRLMSQIGEGVGRLHQTSLNINQEANAHIRLLEGMDDDMERATAGLLEETKHAAKVQQRNKTFWLYVLIVILIIVLILLIVSGL